MQATLTLDANALSHNLACIKTRYPQSKVLAYIKQDAYGLGIEPVAMALADAEGFGVTDMHAGLTLRSMFDDKVIVHAAVAPELAAIKGAAIQDITVVVYSEAMLEIIETNQLKGHYWLKVNTGFNRLGIPVEKVDALLARLNKWSITPVVLMTHFMDANPAYPSFQGQFEKWQSIIHRHDALISHASSNWLLNQLDLVGDWLRPGLMLYGQMQKEGWSLKPVIQLTAPIFQIQTVKKHAYIGYDHEYQFDHDTRVAIVALGYGDGLSLNTKALFSMDGQAFPIVGRVSMDFTAIDIGDYPLNIGDTIKVDLYEMYEAPKQASLVAINRRRLRTEVQYVTT